MIITNLKSIKDFLEKQEMKSSILPASKELPLDMLYVDLGLDEKDRNLILNIKIISEDFSESKGLFELSKSENAYNIIHLVAGLPFQIKPEYAGEVARLVLALNKSISLPGFEMTEIDHVVYFRNAIMAGSELDELIFMTHISNIITHINIFSDIIEDVGEGRKSLLDLVNPYKPSK